MLLKNIIYGRTAATVISADAETGPFHRIRAIKVGLLVDPAGV
jgi:hypothetical protein